MNMISCLQQTENEIIKKDINKDITFAVALDEFRTQIYLQTLVIHYRVGDVYIDDLTKFAIEIFNLSPLSRVWGNSSYMIYILHCVHKVNTRAYYTTGI